MIDERDLLERALHHFEPEPGLTDRVYRRRDRKRRNQRIAAGVVGLAVFVAAVWIVRDVASLDRAHKPAIQPTEMPAVQPTQTPVFQPAPPPVQYVGALPESDYLLDLDTGDMTPLPNTIANRQDLSSDYAVSSDGSRVAFARPGDTGESQIFVADIGGSEVEQVTNDGPAMAPTWSSDGSMISYIARSGGSWNVFVLELATGASRQITFEAEGADSPSFSPDGSSLVYSAEDKVRIVPVSGGKGLGLVAGDGVDAGDGQLSPDGSLLSYGCWDPGGQTNRCLANADGTDARVLVEAYDDLLGGRWSPDGTRIAYWVFHSLGVFVVDVRTGEVAYAGHGASPVWLDDHTLIVSHDRCPGPGSGGCGG